MHPGHNALCTHTIHDALACLTSLNTLPEFPLYIRRLLVLLRLDRPWVVSKTFILDVYYFWGLAFSTNELDRIYWVEFIWYGLVSSVRSELAKERSGANITRTYYFLSNKYFG